MANLLWGELFNSLIKEGELFEVPVYRFDRGPYLFSSMIEQLFCQFEKKLFVLNHKPWFEIGNDLDDRGIHLWLRRKTIPRYCF